MLRGQQQDNLILPLLVETSASALNCEHFFNTRDTCKDKQPELAATGK